LLIGVEENTFVLPSVATDEPSKYSESKWVHFWNADSPSVVQFGKLTTERIEQYANAQPSTVVQFGKLTVVSFEQP
jgi:hypothetical protein